MTDNQIASKDYGGIYIVKEGCVNIEDLLRARPGAVIVRTRGEVDKSICFLHDTVDFGCVAGWISEDD